jgi:7-cyano-7-deazaguanine synthase
MTTKTGKPKLLPILSGGLDSTTMLYMGRKYFTVERAVSFNYGQRHKRELVYAARTCEKLGIQHTIIGLWSSGLEESLSSSESSLVNLDVPIPEGHYGEESMRATVVPNRNMIMFAIAGAIAIADGAQFIGAGQHSGDHFIYPDCRPPFIEAIAEALYLGNEGFGNLWRESIWTPFLYLTKADIAYEAITSGVPFEDTWSCYRGGEIHCGRCGTCVERLEAIDEATTKWWSNHPNPMTPGFAGGFQDDDTEYADPDYWREAIKRETV